MYDVFSLKHQKKSSKIPFSLLFYEPYFLLHPLSIITNQIMLKEQAVKFVISDVFHKTLILRAPALTAGYTLNIQWTAVQPWVLKHDCSKMNHGPVHLLNGLYFVILHSDDNLQGHILWNTQYLRYNFWLESKKVVWTLD